MLNFYLPFNQHKCFMYLSSAYQTKFYLSKEVTSFSFTYQISQVDIKIYYNNSQNCICATELQKCQATSEIRYPYQPRHNMSP